MKIRHILLFVVLLPIAVIAQKENEPYVMLLGITQDGGYPHIGCQRKCCQPAIIDKSKSRNVICLPSDSRNSIHGRTRASFG